MVSDRPQPPLTRQTAPTAFAIRNIADGKARGRLRSAATAEAIGAEMEWVDSDGWRYQLEAPPVVTVSPKDIERAAATVDLRVWDASNTLIFRDRIHAWDGFPVLVPDGTQHEDDDGHGGKVRVSNFRESPVEAARIDLAHTVRVAVKNGPWVKDKPGTVSTFYSGTSDGYIYSSSSIYSTAASGSGTTAYTALTYDYVGQLLTGGYYYCDESFVAFDTSPIPDSDTITSSILSLYNYTDSSDTDFTVEARLYDWGASLTTADWISNASLSSYTLLASKATSGWTTGYNEFSENGSAFVNNTSKTGTTYIVLNSDRHRGGTAPSGNEYVGFSTADETGTTQDPKLVVTHSAATKAFRRSLLGVGV